MKIKKNKVGPWGFEPQTTDFLRLSMNGDVPYKTSAPTKLSYGPNIISGLKS